VRWYASVGMLGLPERDLLPPLPPRRLGGSNKDVGKGYGGWYGKRTKGKMTMPGLTKGPVAKLPVLPWREPETAPPMERPRREDYVLVQKPRCLPECGAEKKELQTLLADYRQSLRDLDTNREDADRGHESEVSRLGGIRSNLRASIASRKEELARLRCGERDALALENEMKRIEAEATQAEHRAAEAAERVKQMNDSLAQEHDRIAAADSRLRELNDEEDTTDREIKRVMAESQKMNMDRERMMKQVDEARDTSLFDRVAKLESQVSDVGQGSVNSMLTSINH